MPSGKPLWPEFWTKQSQRLCIANFHHQKWNAQYQQNPTSEEGALIKREWWQVWEKDSPPMCEFIIQSWDTAFLKTQRSDYSACTTWGVFYTPDEEGATKPNIILLDAYKERLEFPNSSERLTSFGPRCNHPAFIVEAKAAGMPLFLNCGRWGFRYRNTPRPVVMTR